MSEKEQPTIPQVQVRPPAADAAKALDAMTKGYRIHTVGAVNFTPTGAQVLYDYNIPSVYNTYTKEKRASASTLKQEPWVRHGSDNRYPLFLLKLYKGSATLKRGTRTLATLAEGQGITVEGDESGLAAAWINDLGLGTDNSGQDQGIIATILRTKAVFGGFHTLHKFVKQVGKDKGKILAAIEVLPFHNCRPGRIDDPNDRAKTDRLWHSQDFSMKMQTTGMVYGFDWLPMDATKVDPNNPAKNREGTVVEDANLRGRYAFYDRGDSLASGTFPDPLWESGAIIEAALTEASIAAFDKASIENGMGAAYIVAIPFSATHNAEEDKVYKETILNQVNTTMVGAGNAGKAVVVWSDPREKGEPVVIQPIPSSNTGDIQKVLQDRKDRLFCTAFGVVDERLIGIPSFSGKGLSAQDNALRQAEDMWYSAVIYPDIVKPVEQYLTRYVLPWWEGFKDGMKVKLVRRNIVPRPPSDEVMLAVLTRDEIRSSLGYPALTEEQRLEINAEAKDRARNMNPGNQNNQGGGTNG